MTAKNQTPEFRSPGPTRLTQGRGQLVAAVAREKRPPRESLEIRPSWPRSLPRKQAKVTFSGREGRTLLNWPAGSLFRATGERGKTVKVMSSAAWRGSEQHEFCLSLNLPGGLLSKETGGQMVEKGRVGVNKHQNSEGPPAGKRR